jgi:hypothetical protein
MKCINQRKLTIFRIGAALLAIAAVAGCGEGPASTVRGVVTLDGTPLDHGTVTFLPPEGGAGATATIAADGTFEARTGSAEGLDPGDYVVTVQSRTDPVVASPDAEPMPGRLITPERYSSRETTTLNATINPGSNELTLVLTSNAS